MPAEPPEPVNIEAVLDGIPGAFERAQAGARQAAAGDVIALDGLATSNTGSNQATD